MGRRRSWGLIVGLLLGPVAVLPGASLYEVTNLGVPPGYYYADGRGISSNGLVTGFTDQITSAGRAFLYQDGALTNLNPLNQPIYSRGFGVNSSGQVTGYLQATVGSPLHAFIYSDGVLTDITPGDSRSSFGQGINDRGQIVGYFNGGSPTFNSQAFLYENGTFSNLNTVPDHPFNEAYGISQNGLITGRSGTLATAHAFLYQDGNMTDLDPLGSSPSVGYAVNDSGEVAGAMGPLNSQRRAILYRDGQIVDLASGVQLTCEGPMDAPFGEAHGINDFGQVVGQLCSSNYAFIYDNGVIQNLNDLINPSLGVILDTAYGINDHGQIVASGRTINTGSAGQAFLLTPVAVPEPSILALVGVPLLALTIRVCRSSVFA